ncbi:MAG: lipoyl synthase [Deltaproteobacteria bacterium]|nr:lipoyl synthase [Deltaproteobacteria bacterium]
MRSRLPPWFKKKMPDAVMMKRMKGLLGDLSLHTICESALCPNMGDCFSKGTATFLILGDICTRNCTFCAVQKGIPKPLDEKEPENVAEAVAAMELRHAVITSVTRDDLPDGGADHFAKTIRILKDRLPAVTVEVLVPDFRGSPEALRWVASARPDVINHNVETVPRLYPEVRPLANFEQSLRLLRQAKVLDPGIVTKSGVMVGLGERDEELIATMSALREAGCDLLTLGQYLQPSPRHHPVIRYAPPEEFDRYARLAREMGFLGVASAPLVRSSFCAAELFEQAKQAGPFLKPAES